jgi:hypothetical protein
LPDSPLPACPPRSAGERPLSSNLNDHFLDQQGAGHHHRLRAHEVALEAAELGHGVFTHYLLELRGEIEGSLPLSRVGR